MARFKLQCVLLTKIYLNDMLISRIGRFEFIPLGDAAVEIARIKLPIAKTDDLWCCGR